MEDAFGNADEDANQDAAQLKKMLEIVDASQKVIDNPATPVETKLKKTLYLRSILPRIYDHPSASKILGAEGITNMKQLEAGIELAAASAPPPPPASVSTDSPAAPSPATSSSGPKPWVMRLQKNLNILSDSGSLALPSKLKEDGIIGPRTRAAILVFDSNSKGRATDSLIRAVKSAVDGLATPAGGMPLSDMG